MPPNRGDPAQQRFTILLSDDDHTVRRSIQLMLRSRGHHVRGYTSASAVLADPQAMRGDCLIVDYRMPDIDGLTLLAGLRHKGWEGSAILISAYHDRKLEQRARRAGFDDVIAKPLLYRALLEAVARHQQAHDRADRPDRAASDNAQPAVGDEHGRHTAGCVSPCSDGPSHGGGDFEEPPA